MAPVLFLLAFAPRRAARVLGDCQTRFAQICGRYANQIPVISQGMGDASVKSRLAILWLSCPAEAVYYDGIQASVRSDLLHRQGMHFYLRRA